MKTLSESTFKTLAGEGAYDRGLAYYNQGRVGPLLIEHSRITAQVTGSREYSVVLHHTAKLFEGQCNCPASDNFDFCKHCVAVALAYYYQTQVNQELSNANSDSPVLDYLNTLTKPQLAEELHNLLHKDKDTLSLWQLRAEIARGDLGSKEIRKRITKAIPYKPNGLWRYRDVADYFSQCEMALKILEEPILDLGPVDAIKLVSYANHRLQKTLQTVDDSGGYRAPLEAHIENWLSHTFRSERWNNKAKAETLAGLLTNQDPDHSLDASISVLDELKCDAQQAVYGILDKTFDELNPPNDQYSDQYYYYSRIESMLLKRARTLGDLKQEFRILEKGAITVARCIELVELCIQHRQLTEANRWLSHTDEISTFGKNQTFSIESARIKLLKAEGKMDQSFELEWARFEEAEDANSLNLALCTAKELDQYSHYLARGVAYIENKLTSDRSNPKNQRRAGTLVSIHLEHGELGLAYALTNRYLMHIDHLVAIINATNDFLPRTRNLIETIVNQMANRATNQAYGEAIELLKNFAKRLSESDKKLLYQSILRVYENPKNKRKTNFVSRLKEAFPKLFT